MYGRTSSRISANISLEPKSGLPIATPGLAWPAATPTAAAGLSIVELVAMGILECERSRSISSLG